MVKRSRIYTTLHPFRDELSSGSVCSGAALMACIDREGFDGLEINLQVFQIPDAELLLDGLDYSRVSFHSDYREFNLAASNRYVREGCMRQVADEITIARARGVRLLTIHPGRKGKGIGRDESLRHLRVSLEALRPLAEDAGVVLCLENMDGSADKLCSAVEEVRLTLELLPWLALTCDIAHLALAGIDIAGFLGEFSPRIAHVHASGARPGTPHGDVSVPASSVDLQPHLARLGGRDLCIVIENKTLALARESRDVLRGLAAAE